ncbi:MAG: acetyl-CoA carboxylase carboxyl transferase subunit alpha, partial [Acidobacteria bacterium]|nr:acetyl-CoA carboxylase carboxyl transferase subunit alpha [Acidobacteriota bacterium]
SMAKNLAGLKALPIRELLDKRYEKFRLMAQFFTA